MSKNDRAKSPISDIFGKPTGRVGGMSQEQYRQKYPSNVSGFAKTMTSKMSDHVVERQSVRTHSSGGRNNPRGAKGAR